MDTPNNNSRKIIMRTTFPRTVPPTVTSGDVYVRKEEGGFVEKPPRTFIQQNVILILHGISEIPWKAMIAVYDSDITQRLYDCDGSFMYDLDKSECNFESQKWMRDVVLKLDYPGDMGDKLRLYFGPGNVFVIPQRGYIDGRLIAKNGISAIVSVDCDELD